MAVKKQRPWPACPKRSSVILTCTNALVDDLPQTHHAQPVQIALDARRTKMIPALHRGGRGNASRGTHQHLAVCSLVGVGGRNRLKSKRAFRFSQSDGAQGGSGFALAFASFAAFSSACFCFALAVSAPAAASLQLAVSFASERGPEPSSSDMPMTSGFW